MAEATTTQVDDQKLLAYHDKLDAYIKQIDELRDKNTIEDLQAAIHVIEEAFNAGNDDLYKTLKVGRVCLVRKSIDELLKITKIGELRKDVKKYRGNLQQILRKVRVKTSLPAEKISEAEGPVPTTPPPAEPAPEPPAEPEPTAETPSDLPKSNEDLQVKALELLDKGDAQDALKFIAGYFTSIKISEKDFVKRFQKDTAIGMLNNPPWDKESGKIEVDKIRDFLKTLTVRTAPLPTTEPEPEPVSEPPAETETPPKTETKTETRETEFGMNEAYEAIGKEPNGSADRLVMTIRIMTRIKMGATGMDKDFYTARNKYFGIDNSLPIPKQLDIGKKIMSAVAEAKNPFLEAVFNAKVGFDNKKILKEILKSNGAPENAEEAKKKVKEALRQVEEIINKAKTEAVKPATEPAAKPRIEPEPTIELKTKPAPKARSAEMPKDVPDNIHTAIEERIKDNKDNLRRFVLAWRLHKGEAVNWNLNDKDESQIKTILDALDGVKADTPDVQATMKKSLMRLFRVLNKIPTKEAEKAMKDKEEHEKFKVFFDEICVLNEALEKQVKELFDILESNPKDFPKPAHQRLLSQLKDEIRDVLFVKNVPEAMGISEDASREDRLSVIEKMSFREKIQKAKDIKKSIDDDPELPAMLEVYRNKIEPTKKGGKPPEPSKPDIKAPPSDKKEGESKVGPAPGSPEDEKAKKEVKDEKKTEEKEKREREKKREGKEKVAEISDTDIESFMTEILREGSDYIVKGKLKDPTCLAIQKLIKEEIGGKGIDDLKHFLQKPKVELTDEAKRYKKENTIKQLEVLIKEQIDKIDDLNEEAKNKRKMSTEDYKKLLKTRREEINKKGHMELALSSMKEKMQYKTPLQVLTMINFYIEKGDKEEVSSYLDVNILKKAEEQIEEQRKTVSRGITGKVLNFCTGLIKPRLKGILEVLGTKENVLKKIGKEKMAELAEAKEESDVKEWLRSLDGGKEHAYSEVLPLLIAYLEMAIRGGRMINYINATSMGSAKKLLKNLRTARVDHYATEIESETGNEIDLMNKYFGKMNKSMSAEKEVSKKIISNPTYWRLAFGAVGASALISTGGLAAVGLLPYGLGVGFGTLTAGSLVRGADKDLDEDTKKSVRRGAVRSLVAGTLATGAAALGGGLIAVPLMGMAGLFSPELYKKREWFKKKGKQATPHAKKGTMFGLKTIPKFVTVPLLSYGIFTKKGRARLWKEIKR
jgi:hypothetical protein